MRLGLVTYMMAADWDLDTIIQKCQMLGFEGVELRTTHAHGVEVTLDQSQRQEVRKRFQDSDVVLWGLGTTCEYDSPDKTEVEENIRLTKEFIKLAADVGAVGVKVRPNKLHEKEGIPREKTLEQIGLAYRQCGIFAQDFGIELWMEVHGSGTSEPKCIHTIMEV
ncbi:sugar phosphate isomerase/epimerase, partial [candidate division KSB1 bacterium]